MSAGALQRVAPVSESIRQGCIEGQPSEEFPSPLWCFRQPKQIPGHKAEQPLANRIGGAAVAEEAPVVSGNHQSWTPADHRFFGLSAAELKALGYDAVAMRAGGFTANELKSAEYLPAPPRACW